MVSSTTTARDALNAASLYRLFQVLTNEMDRDYPITIPLAFIRIAMAGEEGVDQGKLQDELKTSSSGMSRTIQTLSKVHYLKEREGLDLVERVMDIQDNRRRLLRLTPKGERLLHKCVEIVKDARR